MIDKDRTAIHSTKGDEGRAFNQINESRQVWKDCGGERSILKECSALQTENFAHSGMNAQYELEDFQTEIWHTSD